VMLIAEPVLILDVVRRMTGIDGGMRGMRVARGVPWVHADHTTVRALGRLGLTRAWSRGGGPRGMIAGFCRIMSPLGGPEERRADPTYPGAGPRRGQSVVAAAQRQASTAPTE
jgi:hypothetical protein